MLALQRRIKFKIQQRFQDAKGHTQVVWKDWALVWVLSLKQKAAILFDEGGQKMVKSTYIITVRYNRALWNKWTMLVPNPTNVDKNGQPTPGVEGRGTLKIEMDNIIYDIDNMIDPVGNRQYIQIVMTTSWQQT